jgi:hypothetical protein
MSKNILWYTLGGEVMQVAITHAIPGCIKLPLELAYPSQAGHF